MIARIWSARTATDLAAAYRDHLKVHVLPALRRVDGYLGATLLEHRDGDLIEVIVVTYWQSLESIKGFSGSDIERAVVSEEAAALLTQYDSRVRHYDVTLKDGQPLKVDRSPGQA